MSNYNEIYPLKRYIIETDDIGESGTVELSVNKRLAPIFSALWSDPDGWEGELTSYVDWRDAHPTQIIPVTHGQCDQFRLVRKSQTIKVSIEDIQGARRDGHIVNIVCKDDESAYINLNTILKAIEGG